MSSKLGLGKVIVGMSILAIALVAGGLWAAYIASIKTVGEQGKEVFLVFAQMREL
jgi:threonine/homoserine efflux transporter RhtA